MLRSTSIISIARGGSILRTSGEDELKYPYPSLRNVMRIVNDVVSESFRGLRTSVKLGICGEPQIWNVFG